MLTPAAMTALARATTGFASGRHRVETMVISPPNVSGSLRMGHVFNAALIDTVVRFQRLQGQLG